MQKKKMSDDKQQSGGASLGSGDFRQNTTSATSPCPTFNRSGFIPQPHELTAEWTVRAQLTFTRAGENVRKEFSHSDPVHPVRVVYKWSTFDSPCGDGDDDDDDDDDDEDDDNCDRDDNDNIVGGDDAGDDGKYHPANDKEDSTKYATPLKKKQRQQQQHTNSNRESFRSTTSSTNPDNGGGDSAFSGSTASRKPNRSHNDDAKQKKRQTTNTATSNIGYIGSGDGTEHYGTRCRSTCNIIVSAVADFLPSSSNNTSFNSRGAASSSHQSIPEEPDPFVFNTTANYTVLPEKSNLASKNFSTFGKILDLRDAICQTSDPEMNYHDVDDRRESPHHLQLKQQQQRKLNEHNRIMESTFYPPTSSLLDEGNSFLPSLMSSPTQTCKSASLPRIPPLPSLGQALPSSQSLSQSQTIQKSSSEQPKKPPRTVHIDVYCTGSDEEDDADNDATSSASSPGIMNPYEIESNSTPQTVLNTDQMLLRHQRVSGKAMPRRMILNQKRQGTPFASGRQSSSNSDGQKKNPTTMMNVGHAITKSSTAEEVNESKQLLLSKHVGDQRAVKLQNLRNKYLRKDPSDDCLSSNYPNSSRSTIIRDATCSSISTTMQSPAAVDRDFAGWKMEIEDIDSKCSLAKSDSFDYDNSVDRLRIKQMEKFWSQVEDDNDAAAAATAVVDHMQSTFLQPISEVMSPMKFPKEFDNGDRQVFSPKPPTPTNLNPSAFLHYFGPQASGGGHQHQLLPGGGQFRYRPIIHRWRSEIPDTPSSISEDTNTSNSPTKRCGSETRSIEKKINLPMRSNEAPPAMMSGYTPEYLQKARIFGPVIQIIRKPGHHVGPTKNPTCLCSSCQRWLAERIQIRARAHSVGEKMMLSRPTNNK